MKERIICHAKKDKRLYAMIICLPYRAPGRSRHLAVEFDDREYMMLDLLPFFFSLIGTCVYFLPVSYTIINE